jgi:hypothetical protein
VPSAYEWDSPPPPLPSPSVKPLAPAPPPTHTADTLVTPAGTATLKLPGVSNMKSAAGVQVVVAAGPPGLPRLVPQGWHWVVASVGSSIQQCMG